MENTGRAGARSRLRVYSETLPFEEIVRPRTLALLACYDLELVLAVRPWNAAELPAVACGLRDAGIPFSLWPMLADEDGRWASVHNAPSFCRLVLAICDAALAAGAPAGDVLFDLEPPFAKAQSLAAIGDRPTFSRTWGALWPVLAPLVPSRRSHRSPGLDGASAVLARTVSELHERGLSTSLAVWPMVALDPPGENPWQSLLGTPADALAAGHVSVMMYTSMLEGWSRGALRRRDTTDLLAAATTRSIVRWGARAGVSLGCVGIGALDHEPTYRDPRELAEDVAITRAAGCERLSLFDLGGVLSRGRAEDWLDAFTLRGPHDAEAGAAHESKRVWAARKVARLATRLMGS